ncbi:MAG: hypothetical protein JW809_09125 [Pirellulales bacterium]|nr:hypothetical protein [Pirellulales bacterium]
MKQLIGRETELAWVGRAIRQLAEGFNLPAVGAYLVSCSDETERECAEVFNQYLAQPLLPVLKDGCRAAFHTTNLGARYEPGAIRVVEEHYTTPAARETTKLLVVKINAHVAVRTTLDGFHYGQLFRYGKLSACCGALRAMIEGASLPAVDELAKTFGPDRLDVLADSKRIAPAHQALAAAVAGAALQAARAVEEIVQHAPEGPTVYLVLPCVTLNRPDPDTELVVGQYGIDWTGDSPQTRYRGLGSEPGLYRIGLDGGRLVVEDPSWSAEQPAT